MKARTTLDNPLRQTRAWLVTLGYDSASCTTHAMARRVLPSSEVDDVILVGSLS